MAMSLLGCERLYAVLPLVLLSLVICCCSTQTDDLQVDDAMLNQSHSHYIELVDGIGQVFAIPLLPRWPQLGWHMAENANGHVPKLARRLRYRVPRLSPRGGSIATGVSSGTTSTSGTTGTSGTTPITGDRGSEWPEFITISASTVGYVRLMTEFPQSQSLPPLTSRTSSTPSIRLTTDRRWKSDEVHFFNCSETCDVWISAFVWTSEQVEIVASSNTVSLIPLVEGDDTPVERLIKGDFQDFSYDLKNKDRNVVFTLTSTDGSVEMLVSGRKDWTLSTGWASDAIVLTAGSATFTSALQNQVAGQTPELYVRSRCRSETCTFSIVGREEGDAQVLHNGDKQNGAVTSGMYDRYRFYVGDEELKMGPIAVNVEVLPIMGDPNIYISCQSDHPNEYHHDWGAESVGQDAIHFTSLSPHFKAGWIYVAISARSGSGGTGQAAYGLKVEWGKHKVKLEDGSEEIGRCMQNDIQPFFLVVNDRPEHAAPVAIRAQALVGAISICVAELDNEEDSSLPPSTASNKNCQYRGTADSTRATEAEAGAGLAALDIPPAAFQKGGRLAVLVQGLHATNAFSLRALVDSPTVLTEGQFLVDALGPLCCVEKPIWEQSLTRRYRTFVRPVPGVEIEARALGEGTFVDANLRARHLDAHGELGDHAKPWRWSMSGESFAKTKVTSTLRVFLDLSHDESGLEVKQDFWLEIELSVARPVNFSMEIKTNGSHRVQEVEKVQLLPGLRQQIEAMKPETVQWAVDSNAPEGAWQLQVRQCYGRVAVDLPYTWDSSERSHNDHRSRGPAWNGSDVNIPLPRIHSESVNAAGTAIMTPLTSPPVLYELMLIPGDDNDNNLSSPILISNTAIQSDPTRLFGFQFFAATVDSEALVRQGLLAQGDEAALFYKLVAISANFTLLNANSTCGLVEAIKRKDAEAVKLKQSLTLDKQTLSAKFSSLGDGEYRVNVLVTLISQSGKHLASRCYEPFVFDKQQTKLVVGVQSKLVSVLVLVGIVAGCAWLTNGLKGSSRKTVRGVTSLEMGEPYELQDTWSESSSSASSSKVRGRYVPPEMAPLC